MAENITVKNGRVTSVTIAKHFKIEHDKVVRAIRERSFFHSEDFAAKHFVQSLNIVRGKQYVCYELTLIGFFCLSLRKTENKVNSYLKERIIKAFEEGDR